MPTVITTAGATDANSYCSIAEADAYFDTHVYPGAWTTTDDDDKKKAALIWATRMLDDCVDWLGTKAAETQALRWPRTDITDRDAIAVSSLTIPQFLKNATAELAKYLLEKDRFQAFEDLAAGISSVSAGSVSVDFDKEKRDAYVSFFPDSVKIMVGFYSYGIQTRGYDTPLVRI